MGASGFLGSAAFRVVNFLTFSFLDVLDVLLCRLFGALDRIHGQEWGGCYCSGKRTPGAAAVPSGPPFLPPLPAVTVPGTTRAPLGEMQPNLHGGRSSGASDLAQLRVSMESDVAAPKGDEAGGLKGHPSWHATSDTLYLRGRFPGPHRRPTPQAKCQVSQPSTQQGRDATRAAAACADVDVERAAGTEGEVAPPNVLLPASAKPLLSASCDGTGGGRSLGQDGRPPSAHLTWSDCRCKSCTAWEAGDGHLFVYVGGSGRQQGGPREGMVAVPASAVGLPGGDALVEADVAASELAAAAARDVPASHPSSYSSPQAAAAADIILDLEGAAATVDRSAESPERAPESLDRRDGNGPAGSSDAGGENSPSRSLLAGSVPPGGPLRRQLEEGGRGGPPAIIFIHGFLSSSSFWVDTIFPHLPPEVQKTHRLFAPDLLGFGRSPKPRDCHYTVADHVRWIERSVLERFGVGEFHVVAHSMGCIVGLALAACHVEAVRSVTLLAPPYAMPRAGESPGAAFFRAAAPRRVWPPLSLGIAVMSWYEHVGRAVCAVLCVGHPLWEALLRPLLLLLLKTLKARVPFSFVRDFMQHTHHSAWHIFHNTLCAGAGVTEAALRLLLPAARPVRVVHGLSDAVCPFAMSQELARRHRHMALAGVPGADHVTVVLGREREVVREILAAVSPGTAC